MRVLLAEDDALMRFTLSEMLEELDCTFDTCANGEEAVLQVKANPDLYALILMDIHMPFVTGVTATRRIRDQFRGIRIVAITADPRWQNRARCVDAGFDDVLRKPVSLAELDQVLQAMCPS